MKIELDLSGVQALIGDMQLAPDVIDRAVYRAINKVANKTLTRSRREISSQVNLSAGYVRDRMDLTPAGPGRSVAVISARQRPTRLATYGAKQLTRAAPRGKGDALRSIPAGRKQAGISVGVKRGGGRKKMRSAFFVPIRAGKTEGGNGLGVFIRFGKGKDDIKQLYGPSVDQVFKGVIDEIEPDVERELQTTVETQLEFEIRKVLRT